jgi:branched-chain amino acid transport system ATP-binding protein
MGTASAFGKRPPAIRSFTGPCCRPWRASIWKPVQTPRRASLSHGEKRQLEVGMALSGGPKLLLLDEPYAGMGPGGTVELTRLIQRLKKEVTILLVEHDMGAVFRLADRITVLVYGQAIASGTPDEIRADPTVREAYLGDEVNGCSK